MNNNYTFDYIKKIVELFQLIDNKEKDNIQKAATIIADATKNNKVIHTFGTGHSHMIGIELFGRAGGLANVNAMIDPDTLTSFGARRSSELEKLPGLAEIIYNQYKVSPGDIMIVTSNSGRNAAPIEMAMKAKKEGIYTIALTNLEQSKNTTSRHPSGKKLYECVDLVLDTHVPDSDALEIIGGVKTGPASSLASMIILNTAINEALKMLANEGIALPVLQSQNVDGFNNDDLYAKYEDRVKHF